MASDNYQLPTREWARIQARAIVQAGQQAAGSEGAADVIMIGAARILIALLKQVEFAGQELPDYGPGWLEMVRDYITDRLKNAK